MRRVLLFVVLLICTVAVAKEEAPRDPALATSLSEDALGEAWYDLKADRLAEIAIRLAEGERQIGREHNTLSSRTLTLLAVDLAVETRQPDALARLAKSELVTWNKELAEELRTATRKLAELPLLPDTGVVAGTPTQQLIATAMTKDLMAGRVTGDASAFEIIQTMGRAYFGKDTTRNANLEAIAKASFVAPRSPLVWTARQYLYECQSNWQVNKAKKSASPLRTVSLLQQLRAEGKGLVVGDVAQLLNQLSDADEGWKQVDRVSQRDQVVIYYANETSPGDASQAEFDTLVRWLSHSPDPGIRYVGANLAFDREIFPTVIAREIQGLQKLVQSPKPVPGAPSAVVVFTNQLVQGGNFQVITPQGVSKQPLAYPKAHSALVQDSPLCRDDVFAAALRETAKQFSPDKYDYVLISKSHGCEQLLIMPRYSGSVENLTESAFLEFMGEFTKQHYRDLAKRAEPVYASDRTEVRDSLDRRLMVAQGELFVEGAGRLLVNPEDNRLTFWSGEAYRTKQGSEIRVQDGVLVAGTKLTRLTGQNGDEQILVELKPLLPTWNDDPALAQRLNGLAEQSLGKEWLAKYGKSLRPLVQMREKASATKTVAQSNPKGTLDPSQGGTLDATQGGSLGEQSSSLNDALNRLQPAGRNLPRFSKLDDGVLGIGDVFPRFGKLEDGVLGVGNAIPRFHKLEDGVLASANLLPGASAPGTIVDKSSSDFRSIPVAVGAPDAKQTVNFGITKEQFVATLSQAGNERMFFPVVFLESCKSQLPSVQMAGLKAKQPIGVLFASDVSGLGYQTIDYDALSSQNLPATRFSGLFFHALWKEFMRQQTAVDPNTTADSSK